MKLLKLLFILLLSFNSFSQNHDLSLSFRIGISKDDLKIEQPSLVTRYDYRYVQPFNDKGFVLGYKYRVWKWANLFLTTGLDFSKSKHYQSIIGIQRQQNLENIIIDKSRMGLHFGIGKQINFKKLPKLHFDLGAQIYIKFYSENKKSFSSDYKFNNESWIEYKYEFVTYHKYYNSLNSSIDNDSVSNYTGNMYQFNADVRFEVSDNMYISTGVNWVMNYEFNYDFNYSINYYSNGSTEPTSTDTYHGNVDKIKSVSTTNFVYFNLGLVYKFGKE
jgi:hypothetical protein